MREGVVIDGAFAGRSHSTRYAVNGDRGERQGGEGGGVGEAEGVVHEEGHLLEGVLHLVAHRDRLGGRGEVGDVELAEDGPPGVDLDAVLLAQGGGRVVEVLVVGGGDQDGAGVLAA